jgi:hypothetical protein
MHTSSRCHPLHGFGRRDPSEHDIALDACSEHNGAGARRELARPVEVPTTTLTNLT